jgi:hypothetical protein
MIQELKYTLSIDEIKTILAAHLRVDAKAVRNIEVFRAGDKHAPVLGGLILTIEKR